MMHGTSTMTQDQQAQGPTEQGSQQKSLLKVHELSITHFHKMATKTH